MKTKGISTKFFICSLMLILLVFSFSMVRCAYSASWSVKISYSVGDVYNFLNGMEGYTKSIQDARISYTRTGSSRKFTVLYKEGPSSGGWGWKLATTPTDVVNFLNTVPPYTNPIKKAAIAGEWAGYYKEFYVFYQIGASEGRQWKWVGSTNLNSLVDFINQWASVARIVPMNVEDKDFTIYYTFYQPKSTTAPGYFWRIYSTTSHTTAAYWFNYADDGDLGSYAVLGREIYNVLLRFDY